jgi:hypothetical protein
MSEMSNENIVSELMQKITLLEKNIVGQLELINRNISALNANSKVESLENKLNECAIRANEQILDLKMRIYNISESMTTLQTKKVTKSKAKPADVVSIANDIPPDDDSQEQFIKMYIQETRNKKPGLATSIVEKYTNIEKKMIPNIFANNKTLFESAGNSNAKLELLAQLIYTKFAPEDRDVFKVSQQDTDTEQ